MCFDGAGKSLDIFDRQPQASLPPAGRPLALRLLCCGAQASSFGAGGAGPSYHPRLAYGGLAPFHWKGAGSSESSSSSERVFIEEKNTRRSARPRLRRFRLPPGVQGPDNSRPSGGGAGDGVLSPSQPGLLGPV